MKHKLQAFGLKWDPFSSAVPVEALHRFAQVESLCWRVEHVLLEEGGFAALLGDPGTGKSAALRLLESHLLKISSTKVVALEHASASVSSFYRELGDVFGVALTPRNRWGGFKSLRSCWLEHMEQTLLRPVLLIDEAQEMNPSVLTELRLLSSTRFDSRVILSVVLAGDMRLDENLRKDELTPLGSRLRARIVLAPLDAKALGAILDHRLEASGGKTLLTPALKTLLVERSLGNPRVLLSLAQQLLIEAAGRGVATIDEQLFLEAFGREERLPRQRAKTR